MTKNTTPLQSNKGQLKHIAKKLADIYKLLPKDSSKIMSLDDPRVGMAAKWSFRHIKSALTPERVTVLSDKTLKEGTYQYKNYGN